MSDWRSDVLKFWFGLDNIQWFATNPALDHEIDERFRDLWSKKRQLPPEHFTDDALTALAAIILFDQFPRNIFRGHADQFSTDPLALAIARRSVASGLDQHVQPHERMFFYLPFEHSESLADQDQSMLLFTKLGDPELLDYAKKHRSIIERFGRFPHRNAMLGRAPRADEIAAGDVNPF